MTKYEKARQARIAEILSNERDSGRFGKVDELLACRPNSRKVDVSKQNETDNHLRVSYNGKVRNVGFENKTNGGRVEKILDGSQKEAFVVYSLSFTQKHKATKKAEAWEELRIVPKVIIPTELFRSLLVELGCYKDQRHGGKVDGIGIQPSSKKLYERLTAYVENYGESVLFSTTKVYESWELEGLEI